MSRACERTIGRRIRIKWCDGASARCSASSQPDRPSAFSACTPPSTTPSTSSATSSPDRRFGSSDPKRRRSGRRCRSGVTLWRALPQCVLVRRCRDKAAVSPEVFKPLASRVRLLTRTSRRHDGSVGTSPSERPVRFVVPPLALLGCGCLEDGVAIHMGIMQSRYERSFSSPVPQVRLPYAFADRRLLFESIGAVSNVRRGLDGGFAAARQRCWRAVHNPRGRQQQRVVETST